MKHVHITTNEGTALFLQTTVNNKKVYNMKYKFLGQVTFKSQAPIHAHSLKMLQANCNQSEKDYNVKALLPNYWSACFGGMLCSDPVGNILHEHFWMLCIQNDHSQCLHRAESWPSGMHCFPPPPIYSSCFIYLFLIFRCCFLCVRSWSYHHW